MISRALGKATRVSVRAFSTTAAPANSVAVLGAAGGIGQPLSLLLKNSPHVSDLRLYDVVNTPGVAADISHIDTRAKVTGYEGQEQVGQALEGANVVVIPAGLPRKPGMTRDDLFVKNASIVQGLIEACAKHCPAAHLLIISNPVNSTVPIAAETLKKAGVYNPRRLFGVTTLDVVRANTFVAEAQGWNPDDLEVTVVGGHAGKTILPLLSQVKDAKLTEEQIQSLTHRIQFGGDEVVQAKAGAGSATLSMAYAGYRFAERLMRAIGGESGIAECTFVESSVTEAPFFSSRVELGKEGVEKIHEVGPMSDFEKANFDEMMPALKDQIQKGIDFANK